jgi:hypothetical protein
MPVAVRRRIDENQQLFLGRIDAFIFAATLRADVNRRLPRQPAVRENVVEFGKVVGREKYVVTAERKPFRFRNEAPGHRRQRTCMGRDRGGGAAGAGAEPSSRDRGDIGIDDHGVGFNAFSARKPDPAGASVRDENFGGFLVVS